MCSLAQTVASSLLVAMYIAVVVLVTIVGFDALREALTLFNRRKNEVVVANDIYEHLFAGFLCIVLAIALLTVFF